MIATSPTITDTLSAVPAPDPFAALDFLQHFLVGIHNGVRFRTADGSQIRSTIEDGKAIAPAQMRRALDTVADYFSQPPGLSAEMSVDRTQRLALHLAEIIKFQARPGSEVPARITAYELGNAVAALQEALKDQTPGKN